MAPIVIGRTRAEVAARLARGREWFPRVPESEAEWRAQSFLFGSVDEVVRDLRRWQGLGVQGVMLQCLDVDDLAAHRAHRPRGDPRRRLSLGAPAWPEPRTLRAHELRSPDRVRGAEPRRAASASGSRRGASPCRAATTRSASA